MGLSFCYDEAKWGAALPDAPEGGGRTGKRLRKLYPGAKNDVNYAENCALSAWVLFCDRYL